jgi:hypothetical protein
MQTLQQQIIEKFLASLAESEGWDAGRLNKLREVLTAEKQPKADDFVRVFTMPAGGEIE